MNLLLRFDNVLWSVDMVSGGRYTMFSMRVHHNGVFKYWSGRIYDGGMESLVDLVDVDSVSVEELDVLMYELGYDLRQKITITLLSLAVI